LLTNTGPAASGFRLLIAAAVVYYAFVAGAFSGPPWRSVGLGVGIVAWFVALITQLVTRSRGAVWAVGAMVMLPAGAIADERFGIGWILFCVATFMLFGRDTGPFILRMSVALWAASAIALVALQIIEQPSWSTFLGNALGAAGVLLVSIIRKQTHQRRRQDRELAERSQELEERNAELVDQTEKTRAEAARVAALQERSRIARDIHDLLAHSLGGLVIQLDAAEAELSATGDAHQVAERLRASQAIARDGLQDARNAVRELRAEPAGESSSLVDVADRVATIVGGPVGNFLGVQLDVLGEPWRAPAAVAAAFTAVARESLTNINKHAPGQRVSASLIFEDNQIRLEMINGLPADEATPGPSAGSYRSADLSRSGSGLGLGGMSRRMTEVGGIVHSGREGNRWIAEAQWHDAGNDPETGDTSMPEASASG
jgi:signal transduction histidine kinase